MREGLLDTSVVIAIDDRGSLEIPERSSISVITLGELRAGLVLAADNSVRMQREARLNFVRRTFATLTVDDHVAHHYGEALAWARSKRRATKASDLLIIATARALELTLVTLDRAQASIARELGVRVADL